MWQDRYVLFTKGLNLGSAEVLDGNELQVAENVDWDRDGTIKGRPARATPALFVVNNAAPVSFPNTGYAPLGLGRLRDVNAERPYLATAGKLFSLESGRWADRGPFASARVDRPVNYVTSRDGAVRLGCSPDFGPQDSDQGAGFSGTQHYTLLTDVLSADRVVAGSGGAGSDGFHGTGARCGTTTAILSRAVLNTNLYLVYRLHGDDTVTTVTVASDCRNDNADAITPVLCCSHAANSFWAIYRSFNSDEYTVKRLSPTGSVLATFTGTFPGLSGFWIDNTSDAGNRLVVALTGTAGLQLKVLDATTLDDLSLDSTHALGGAIGAADVAVGAVSDSLAVWGYRSTDGAFGDGNLCIGSVSLTAGSSATLARTLGGGGPFPQAGINWGICHQPIVVGGRTYLTLVAAAVTDAKTGTWLTLDVTDLFNWQIVARGPSNATIPWHAAAVAVPLADDSGWTFPTVDWTRFSSTVTEVTGLDAYLGLNRVALTSTRSALVGESTIFSGSIPHVVQRGLCAELGFPFLAGQPGLDATTISGGGISIGSYTLAAVWRWTDETGVIHRSSPSPLRTTAITSGNNTLLLTITNPALTEKQWGALKIELYCSDRDSTPDSPHYLVYSGPLSAGSSYTQVSLNALPDELEAPVPGSPGTEALYTDGDEFANFHVPADGGVATLGRRVWLASGSTAYASKLLVPGKAPGFNDEGQLQVNLPAGAGRILALESMDDKLVIFCARGVFVVRDGGPDNTGVGLDFGVPERVADLGISSPQSTCATDKGIVFAVPVNAADVQSGGPWLLSRSAELQYLGRPVLAYCRSDSPQQLCYSPERQALFLSFDQRSTAVPGTDATGVVMMDLRTMRWAVWLNRDSADGALRFIDSVSGALWTLANEPAPLNQPPGTDSGSAGPYAMRIRTSHLYSNGLGGLGWSRVRGIRVLGTPSADAHTLTISATLDQTRSYSSTPFDEVKPTAGVTWPSTRQAPEWRLPSQKCSSIQVELSATPATAQWSALALQVAPPIPTTAPALQRA